MLVLQVSFWVPPLFKIGVFFIFNWFSSTFLVLSIGYLCSHKNLKLLSYLQLLEQKHYLLILWLFWHFLLCQLYYYSVFHYLSGLLISAILYLTNLFASLSFPLHCIKKKHSCMSPILLIYYFRHFWSPGVGVGAGARGEKNNYHHLIILNTVLKRGHLETKQDTLIICFNVTPLVNIYLVLYT